MGDLRSLFRRKAVGPRPATFLAALTPVWRFSRRILNLASGDIDDEFGELGGVARALLHVQTMRRSPGDFQRGSTGLKFKLTHYRAEGGLDMLICSEKTLAVAIDGFL